MPLNTLEATDIESSQFTSLNSGKCICCNSSEWSPKFRVLMQCDECGYIRADTEVTPEQIKRLYQEDYFRGKEYGNYLADEATHRTNFAWRFKMLKKVAPDIRSIFEIGCAYGFWLECCANNNLPCAGVDVCEEAASYARNTLGQNAVAEDFLTMDIEPGRFDAFCMWDTIEHLANPELFLARANELLAPGGWLFMTTGDIGSTMAKWRGPHWRLIHPPTHLQYFSIATMDRFLKQHSFAAVDWQTQPMFRNFGEVLGRVSSLGQGISKWSAQTLTAILPKAIKRNGFWLDFGDIMFVAARKTV